jgi:putative ABC transport system substrate-binding protein
VVVVFKSATHPALDEVEQAFIKAFETAKQAHPELRSVEIVERNADGATEQAARLAEASIRPNVKLIVAFGTSAAQAVSRLPSDIPLLYAAVSDPDGAGLFQHPGTTGIKNVDTNIVERAVAFIRQIHKDVKVIGTIYNPIEQNSVFVQGIMDYVCSNNDLHLERRRVSGPAEIAVTAEAMAKDVDVFYSANDNTVNRGIASLVSVADGARKPFIIGELSAVPSGPLAGVGVDYTKTGIDLAAMAIEILGGKPIRELPPRPAPPPEIWINTNTCTILDIKLPDEVVRSANKLCP